MNKQKYEEYVNDRKKKKKKKRFKGEKKKSL